MKEFLESMRSEGRHDSEGIFTLDAHKALGTLAGYLLANDGCWILKLVQAACLAKAPSMAVTTKGGLITVEIQFPYQFEHRAVRENLGINPDPVDPALNSLCEGLRAVGFGEKRPMLITAEGKSETTLIRVRGDVVREQRQEREVEESRGVRLTVHVPLHPKRLNQELEQLQARARTCEVPLTVNSRRLDDLNLPRSDISESSKYLGVAWVGHGRLPVPQAVRPDTGPGSPLYTPPFLDGACVERLLAIHYHYTLAGKSKFLGRKNDKGVPGLSRLHLVSHGVLVASQEFGFHQPVTVDLFAPTRRCDASGLAAKIRPRMVERAPDTVALFGPALASLAQTLSAGPALPEGSSALKRVRTYMQWSGKQANVVTGASSALDRFRHALPRVIRK